MHTWKKAISDWFWHSNHCLLFRKMCRQHRFNAARIWMLFISHYARNIAAPLPKELKCEIRRIKSNNASDFIMSTLYACVYFRICIINEQLFQITHSTTWRFKMRMEQSEQKSWIGHPSRSLEFRTLGLAQCFIPMCNARIYTHTRTRTRSPIWRYMSAFICYIYIHCLECAFQTLCLFNIYMCAVFNLSDFVAAFTNQIAAFS